MPHHFGYRARTRHLFAKNFRQHGMPNVSTYLRTYKVGDYVDIVCDSAVQAGMPHKFYHGRTGVVWNVTPRAVGVEVNKVIGNRIIKKRLHVRVEHVRKSKCQQEFKARVKANDARRREAIAKKKEGVDVKLMLKRLPEQPKEGKVVKVEDENFHDIAVLPFELDI